MTSTNTCTILATSEKVIEADEQIETATRKPIEFGRFHVLTCIMGFLFLIFGALTILSGMFINIRQYNCTAQQPPMQQELEDTFVNVSSPTSTLELTDELWSEHQGFRSSISVQYRLCNHRIGDLTNVALLVGAIIGSIVTGPTSDTIGRMPCIIAGQVLASLSCLASSYAPSFWLHLVSRFFAGCFVAFTQCAIQVYGAEVHSLEHRGRFLASWSSGVSVGTLATALLAHLTRDHQLYIMIASCVPILTLLICVCLPESPAWLAAKGRPERAEAALKRIDAINGRPKIRRHSNDDAGGLPLRVLSSLVAIATANAQDDSDAGQRNRRGFRAWNCDLARLMGIIGLHSLFLGLNCYGFYFVMSRVIPDVCLYAALIGATQLPYLFVLNLIPRRSGLIFLSLLSSLICFGFGGFAHFLPEWQLVLAGLGVAGCFCSTAAFNLLVTLSAEHFPTSIRNTSLGLCTFCLRSGSAISPFINFLPGELLQAGILAGPLLFSNLLLGLTFVRLVRANTDADAETDADLEDKEGQEKVEFSIK